MAQDHARPRSDILIVDDNPANILAVETALGDLAENVVRAQSGAEALRVLLERDFALILLDVKMPTMDGFETARFIRERKRSRYTPIIFMTAYSRNDQEILAAYKLGAVDFLFKPVVAEMLRAKAGVFVELERRAAELTRQAELLREHERREHERTLEQERTSWEQQALEQRMQELAEADRRKDEFLAILGHELRNPLAPIVSGLDLLRAKFLSGSNVDESLARIHARMQRQVEHLTRLVDDLLDVARINSGKIDLRKSWVTLQEVVDHALAESRGLVSERNHRVSLDLPEEPIHLVADAVRLTQVLTNLLNNAARYTDPGGSIRVAARTSGQTVEISVADNGNGISAAALPLIFEVFVQERTNRGPGLGLGLSLVKRLVDLHGGSVEALSPGVGLGSTFIVRLSLPTPEEIAACGAPPRSHTETPSRRSLKIAIVEDNDDVRNTLQELLRTLGHQTATAADGTGGAEMILATKPDVAFVDLDLPGMDGLAVAAKVRGDLGPDRVRLVAVSGFGQDSDRERVYRAGFDAHLVKPVDLQTLVQSLPTKED
jgi:two-component system, sensor histidine kinase